MPASPSDGSRFFHSAVSKRGAIERDGNVLSSCRYTLEQFVGEGEPNALQRMANFHIDDDAVDCKVGDVLVADDGSRWQLQDVNRHTYSALGRLYDCRVNREVSA